MIYLANAFSLQMIEPGDVIYTKEIEEEEFIEIMQAKPFKSIIGHKDTANVLTDLCKCNVECNRESIKLTELDSLYVAQVIGGRLPEGCLTLPEGFKFSFIMVLKKRPVSPNELLIDFMKEKAKLLKYPDYFREKDAENIRNWPEMDCLIVIDQLESYSDGDSCPFCMYSENCVVCEYGIEHGICGCEENVNNTYSKMLSEISSEQITENVQYKISELIKNLKNECFIRL